ncbi:MAG: carboxypeptidase regulatory-like domain-containing protein [Acidobacteria bacterium]|nr:carboxypeptidase regulatory-like domain-containing protein [Acidobacteriota bacterium]
MTIEVTDRTGAPVGDVQVALAGPVDRSGATGQDGTMVFRSLRPGTYRLRFEREGFTTLEREVVVRAGQPPTVAVVLTPAPVEQAAPPPPVVPPPPAARPARAVDARTLSLPDFLEKNFVGSDPLKTSLLACADGGTGRLLQIRDPLENQEHADADEFLYVVAGEGTVRVKEQETKVRSGFFALVPRGFPHTLRRQGRNPLIVLSVLGGAPCTESAR